MLIFNLGINIGIVNLILALFFYIILLFFKLNIRFLYLINIFFVVGICALIFGIFHPTLQITFWLILFEPLIYISFGLFFLLSLFTGIDMKRGKYTYYNHGQYFWWGLLFLISYLIFK